MSDAEKLAQEIETLHAQRKKLREDKVRLVEAIDVLTQEIKRRRFKLNGLDK